MCGCARLGGVGDPTLEDAPRRAPDRKTGGSCFTHSEDLKSDKGQESEMISSRPAQTEPEPPRSVPISVHSLNCTAHPGRSLCAKLTADGGRQGAAMADDRQLNLWLVLLICALIVALIVLSGYFQPALKSPFGH